MSLRVLFVLAAVFFAAGCQSTRVQLPPLPAWEQPTDASTYSSLQVLVRSAATLPGVPTHTSDGQYTLVSHAWLERYLAWTWETSRIVGIRYTPESFDCEDFALAFHSLAALAASRSGQRTAPLLARVVVQLPNGRHELIGAATDRGLFIVEPQPDAGPFRTWPLAEYRQRARILSVVFGDYNAH